MLIWSVAVIFVKRSVAVLHGRRYILVCCASWASVRDDLCACGRAPRPDDLAFAGLADMGQVEELRGTDAVKGIVAECKVPGGALTRRNGDANDSDAVRKTGKSEHKTRRSPSDRTYR